MAYLDFSELVSYLFPYVRFYLGALFSSETLGTAAQRLLYQGLVAFWSMLLLRYSEGEHSGDAYHICPVLKNNKTNKQNK